MHPKGKPNTIIMLNEHGNKTVGTKTHNQSIAENERL